MALAFQGNVSVLRALALLLLLCAPALAQEHQHPVRDQAIHDRFYSTWMMPDNKVLSCCNQVDCAPAESKFENGHWMARKLGDKGDWVSVPDQKVEQDRDSPDGRSHLCGHRYEGMGSHFITYCFVRGSGT